LLVPGNVKRWAAARALRRHWLEGSVGADLTRRVVLASAAALPLVAVSGCGIRVVNAPPKPAPAVTGLHSAIAAEELLISRYQAALSHLAAGASSRRSRALTAVLTALLAEHRAHLGQLQPRLIVPPGSAAARAFASESASAPASASGSASGSASAGAARNDQVPTAPAAMIAFLATAERDASAVLLRRLRGAPSSLAQLYASIAASEATHVPVLRAAGRTA
jgi:hypothetical protein